jgi:hypothetical protein
MCGVCRMTEYEKLQQERLDRERVANALRYQARAAAIAGIAAADR